MPVLYCLTPLPTLVLHTYDRSLITDSVRNNLPPNTNTTHTTMLDAFFAGRRRPACAPPPPVTSAPTMSPYTSEELIGMYTSRSSPVAPPPDGVYVPSNRSSYSPGEARKSLLAYMDSDNYSYHDADVLSSGTNNATAGTNGQDHLDARTPRSAATQQQQNAGFLASVWALGRYLSVATASSTREVVNDVVTMAAGFKREKRSYAASVGSSANMDDFVGSEEGESVTEEEEDYEEEEEDEDLPYRPDTVDKGKSREYHAGYQAGGPSNPPLASHDPIPSPPSTATETVVAEHRGESETETETVVSAVVSDVEAMPSSDQRPLLERHQSKSQSELRPNSEVVTNAPRRSPSLMDLKEAEKDARQDDIRNMLRESVTAAEAVAAAPGPVMVADLPAKELVEAKDSTPEPTPTATKADSPPLGVAVEIPTKEEDATPETPPKSPLRNRNSVSGSPSSSHHEFAAPEVAKAESVEEVKSFKEEEGKTEVADKNEVPPVVPEASGEETKEKAMPDLKGYSEALSSMLLNPTARSTVVEDPETATAEIAKSTPEILPTEVLAKAAEAATPEITKPSPEIPASVPVEAPEAVTAEITKQSPKIPAEVPVEALATTLIEIPETAASEGREFSVAEFSDTIASTPLASIAEAKEEKREPVKVQESLRKISVDSKVSAFTEADAAVTPTPETKAEEKPAEKAEKAPSITSPPGLERRKSNAFRRDTIQRSLSMFRKKDKNKSKDSNELPAATTTSAVELTPPPTPPHTDDQTEKGETPAPAERPKPASRMSMFALTKTLKEKAAKEAAAASAATATAGDGDSAIAALSSTLASEAGKSKSAESPAAASEKPELKKRASFISIAESFRSQRPATSAGMLTTTKEGDDEPKTPQRRPTFRPFTSSGDKSKSRTKSWFGGDKKPKVNDKGELVDPRPSKDDDAPITPDNTSSIAPSIAPSTKELAKEPTKEPASPVPETPAKEAKPKFFRSPSIKRAPTFGLANRSLSSSAVSMGTTATTGTTATDATAATGTDSPTTKSKGAARMKGLVRASTFMGMSKRKDKGKGKEVAAE
ncbi:hypothetical protein BZA05DRAFT_96907 [Tricharina praecox]|uniref:uncharacterized protein n=1 Tax=Tricharina praecox TaxID=43433 RepID=UPI00221F96CF|nr:uncharacterized protein BZA05DRAFT_96907 [Tricharina praecox]KAI5848404.1 hypothetical protein BZA05DRAFT_96907 [Tricharina praecox]